MSCTPHQAAATLTAALEQVVVGQSEVITTLVTALLCDGHVLIEGLPGTAKTRSVKQLANALGVSLGRIQFTPDLLPADVTGSELYHEEQGAQRLTFEPGPIFNELVLADEINRAPAKVQSALLEAMAERQVTVAGKSYSLPDLFLVLATQNPIDQDGTYPLPEAQLDRFLLKVRVDYPDAHAERRIIRMLQQEELQPAALQKVASSEQILAAREAINSVTISDAVENYIIDLIMATRRPGNVCSDLARWLNHGASPRGSIALHRAARAHAWLDQRDYVIPDDVKAMCHPVLRHRLTLSFDALADGIEPDHCIDILLERVAVA